MFTSFAVDIAFSTLFFLSFDSWKRSLIHDERIRWICTSSISAAVIHIHVSFRYWCIAMTPDTGQTSSLLKRYSLLQGIFATWTFACSIYPEESPLRLSHKRVLYEWTKRTVQKISLIKIHLRNWDIPHKHYKKKSWEKWPNGQEIFFIRCLNQ